MSTDLMPNRYRPGESDLPRRESELIARRDEVLGPLIGSSTAGSGLPRRKGSSQ